MDFLNDFTAKECENLATMTTDQDGRNVVKGITADSLMDVSVAFDNGQTEASVGTHYNCDGAEGYFRDTTIESVKCILQQDGTVKWSDWQCKSKYVAVLAFDNII